MESPRTTREALKLTIDGWAALERELAGLGETELLRRGTVGDWTLRDLLAHLGASNRWIAGQLDAVRRGAMPDPIACFGHDEPPGPDVDMENNDSRNAWYHAHRARWPLAQVREECAQTFGWFVAGLAWLPDDEWAADYTFVVPDQSWVAYVRHWTPADGDFRFSFERLIEGYAWKHYAEHLEDVRRARAALVASDE
jgi:hypothetical protein